jgi:hypothetical protein
VCLCLQNGRMKKESDSQHAPLGPSADHLHHTRNKTASPLPSPVGYRSLPAASNWLCQRMYYEYRRGRGNPSLYVQSARRQLNAYLKLYSI